MKTLNEFYIDGEWTARPDAPLLDIVNPASEEAVGRVAMGSSADVDAAVAAARAAFPSFAATSRADRLTLLGDITQGYLKRRDDVVEAVVTELGAPMSLADGPQADIGYGQFAMAAQLLQDYAFEEQLPNSKILREPIGVCGLITPWNWPLNQIACKIAPALAVGCTMVWKPSEMSSLSSQILMEVIADAGAPKGVVNLVFGDGPTVGAAIASHPQVDMVSFTGSTRGGVAVATASAPTVKRVSQELGGKSANILLDDLSDEEFATAIHTSVATMMLNSGQNCNAPSRMLIPRGRMAAAKDILLEAVGKVAIGDPRDEATRVGPVISEAQYNRIQSLIETGLKEGGEAIIGGPGRPEGLNRGFYVRPTVFFDVSNQATIAREEIFGPVMVVIAYGSEDEAVEIANDTDYGLSGYVSSGDKGHAIKVASQIRTGMVHINGAGPDLMAPFGGYKQSGNGREWGALGFEEYLEAKALMGVSAG